MKNKFITSVLSVPVTYLIWLFSIDLWANVLKSNTIWSNLLSGLVGILALLCLALNLFLFILAMKRRDQPYAKLTAISSGFSCLIAATIIIIFLAAIIPVLFPHSA